MIAVYKTTDIVLAATLKYNSTHLADVEMEGTRGTFVFKNVDDQLLTDFDLGNILVEPCGFHNIIKQLSSIVRRKANN